MPEDGPKHLEELCDSGVERYLEGDVDSAVSLWRQADELGSARAAYNLGVVASESGEVEQACTYWVRAASEGHLDAIFNLSTALDGRGEAEAARRWLWEAAGRGHPRSIVHLGYRLWQEGDSDGAVALLRPLASEDSLQARVALAVITFNEQDLDAAEFWSRRAIELPDEDDPESMARAWAFLGLALEAQGRPSEAVPVLERATSMGATEVEAVLEDARFAVANGDDQVLAQQSQSTSGIGSLAREPDEEPTDGDEAASPTSGVASSVKFCTNCGNPRPDGGRFCGHCGTPFPEEAKCTPTTSASAERLVELLGEYGQWHLDQADPFTDIDQVECEHLAPWSADLVSGVLQGIHVEPLLESLHTGEGQASTAIRLLARAELDNSFFIAMAVTAQLPDGQIEGAARQSALGALFHELHVRLGSGTWSRTTVNELCYLLEGTLYFGDSLIMRDEVNGPVYGGIASWLPPALTLAKEYLIPNDLAELNQVAGASMIAAMCPMTDPDVLRVLYSGAMAAAAADNPNLPPDIVEESLNGPDPDLYLLFHPNANPDTSWEIIERLLEDGDVERLEEACREWQGVDEDGVARFAGFQMSSAIARVLKARIREWCLENTEQGDEFLEMLDLDVRIQGESH